MVNADIDRTILKTKQYWYEDGLSELGAAAVFAAVAGVFALEVLAPEGSILAIPSAFTLPIAVLVGVWLVGRIVPRAKERITYPRSGLVVYRQPTRRHRTLGAIVAAIVAVVVSVLFVSSSVVPSSMQWVPLFTASIVGLVFVFIGATVGLTRFYLLGVASVAAGYVAARTFPDPSAGSAVYFGVMAAALALSGAATLRRYLRAAEPINGATVATEAK